MFSLNLILYFYFAGSPQFSNLTTNFIPADVASPMTFNIKSHATAVVRCLITSASVGSSFSKEVDCTITGTPPDLLLTVRLERERLSRGNWTLSIINDKGTANLTLFVSKRPGK